MAKTSTSSWSNSSSQSHSETSGSASSRTSGTSESRSRAESESRSETRRVLDEETLGRVLSGLTGRMSDEEIDAYAENLLRPQLEAGLEAERRGEETARLEREQQIEDLAAALTRDIGAQEGAYRRSMADVETAALARGMGRSSYTVQTLANQGDAMAAAVRALTEESERKREQLRRQTTQIAEQSARAQGRLYADYERSLAAKRQELRSARDERQNSDYLTALSASMGSETTQRGAQTGYRTDASSSRQETLSSSTTDATGSASSSGGSTTTTSSGGSKKSANTSGADQKLFAAGNVGRRASSR